MKSNRENEAYSEAQEHGDQNIKMVIEMIAYCFASGCLYDMKRYKAVVL